MMTQKYLLTGLITACLLAVIFYWHFQLPNKENPPPLTETNPAIPIEIKKERNHTTAVTVANIDPVGVQPSSVKIPVGYTEQDIREMTQFVEEGIAGTAFPSSDYAHYDEATLLAMVDTGDVMAMKSLWQLYLSENKEADGSKLIHNLRKMDMLVTQAIIHGDREMFVYMPEFIDAKSRVSSPNLTPQQRHDASLTALAYAEFMGLRGYWGDKYSRQTVFFRVYSTPESPIRLSEQDKAEIRARAKTIYNVYEKRRLELGLGPFDNSVPDGVRKHFERQKQSYLEELGDNAIY